MDINFEWVLVCLVGLVSIVVFIDKLFFARNRTGQRRKWLDHTYGFFPILLFVLLFRSFLIEPFRIPSGSLEPTLLIGDFVTVNKFSYGLRLPIIRTQLVPISKPKRGDIVVLHWPPNPNIYYIKRVIGQPGDTVIYQDKKLMINGEVMEQALIKQTTDFDAKGQVWPVDKKSENLGRLSHSIYIRPSIPAQDFTVTVPQGHYFVLGDNRDDSGDSRYWGFVPEKLIIGRASYIWFSWNGRKQSIRWERFGKRIV